MGIVKNAFLNVYDTHYKKFLMFSIILLVLAFVVLGVSYSRTGEFFKKGVSLKGGITMTVPVDSPVPIDALEQALSEHLPNADISVREITEGGRATSLIIEAADVDVESLEQALRTNNIVLEEGKYSVESMGSALGESFYIQTVKAVIYAFIAMAIVVLITFRAFVPSFFVILAAFSDIVSTLAVANILGIRMSTAGIAAFLMLIGYSVDTDILLTTKVLKRRHEGGTLFSRTIDAMKTGLTMTLTGFAAAFVGYLFTQSETIKQIMLIIAIGMLFDIIYTWAQNAVILRWWMEKKYGKD